MGDILAMILGWGVDKLLKLLGLVGGFLGLWWLSRSRKRAQAEAKAYKTALEIQQRQQEIKREAEQEVQRVDEKIESGDVDAIVSEYDRVRQYAKDKS